MELVMTHSTKAGIGLKSNSGLWQPSAMNLPIRNGMIGIYFPDDLRMSIVRKNNIKEIDHDRLYE